jgi:hypothetical protein
MICLLGAAFIGVAFISQGHLRKYSTAQDDLEQVDIAQSETSRAVRALLKMKIKKSKTDLTFYHLIHVLDNFKQT